MPFHLECSDSDYFSTGLTTLSSISLERIYIYSRCIISTVQTKKNSLLRDHAILPSRMARETRKFIPTLLEKSKLANCCTNLPSDQQHETFHRIHAVSKATEKCRLRANAAVWRPKLNCQNGSHILFISAQSVPNTHPHNNRAHDCFNTSRFPMAKGRLTCSTYHYYFTELYQCIPFYLRKTWHPRGAND